MTFLQFLYQLIIAPLELLFEIIYSFSYRIMGDVGLSIIPLSLIINFLLLPFYNRADQIQKEQHDKEAKLAPGIEHLKKAFKGDKRFMILQTYYRQNNYSPLSALRSSFAVFLEIPFFIAAYHFLSNFKTLQGASLGPLTDLGSPDALICIAGVSINVLPILMTLINIVSSKVYAKDLSKKDEIRMYAISLVFLVLLYRSPSGLVFYWTLNQIFSLLKNVIKASDQKQTLLDIMLIFLSMMILIYALLVFNGSANDLKLLLIIAMLPLLYLLVFHRSASRKPKPLPEKTEKQSVPYGRIFFFSALFLSLLTGIFIPSSVVVSSPSEFVVFTAYKSPLNFIILTFALAVGFFVIWCGLFYYLSTQRIRRIFSITMCSAAICSLLNFYLSGRHLSFMDSSLAILGGLTFPKKETLIDLLVIPIIIGGIILIWKKRASIIPYVLLFLSLGTAAVGVRNMVSISHAMPRIKMILERENSKKASFNLSREGKNVVVIMLDRAISCYVPYLLNERPELRQQFDGFTWYPNTISFGGTTNTGSPALFGGYEYQPKNMNARTDLPLAKKQNEALRVMPVLFDEAGYDVTVCDPPYAGYSTPPDLSIYDDHPDIHAYLTQYGQYWDNEQNHKRQEHIWTRNFFCYGFSRILPLPAQNVIYDDGRYRDPNWKTDSLYQTQYILADESTHGICAEFMYSYSFLQSLVDTTTITEGKENTFMMMDNCTTHNVVLLQQPEYEPAMRTDNREYNEAHKDRFTVDGKSITMNSFFQMAHYHSNMAAYIQLGKWFDYLREQGVYDNTRIIIVSDHGYYLEHMEELVRGHKYVKAIDQNPEDMLAYNALLMVKDFDSTGFTIDNTFMTNADTPVLAFEDLIKDPVNPATGNPINNDQKFEDKLFIMYTPDWRINTNNGNTYSKGIWYSLKNRYIFDPENWEEEGVW